MPERIDEQKACCGFAAMRNKAQGNKRREEGAHFGKPTRKYDDASAAGEFREDGQHHTQFGEMQGDEGVTRAGRGGGGRSGTVRQEMRGLEIEAQGDRCGYDSGESVPVRWGLGLDPLQGGKQPGGGPAEPSVDALASRGKPSCSEDYGKPQTPAFPKPMGPQFHLVQHQTAHAIPMEEPARATGVIEGRRTDITERTYAAGCEKPDAIGGGGGEQQGEIGGQGCGQRP